MSSPIVVDRIEGTRAVLVVGDEQLDVPASILPAGTGEGDVVLLQKGDASAIRDAAAQRQARLAAASNLSDEIDL